MCCGAAVANSPELRRRAEVLAPQRCAQCRRKPLEDHVKLVVDHKVPLSWGGDNEPENLQPLCEECNSGKRDYFRSFEAYAEQIRAAIGYDEPQKRIGELLRAFDGGWVRSDLLAASSPVPGTSRRTGNVECETCDSCTGTTNVRSGMARARECGLIAA
jgi:hypothetical protein